MPAYRYDAVDAMGASSKGVVHAESPRAARSDLRSRGLLPLAVEIITTQAETGGNWLTRRLDRKSTRLNSSHVSESRMPSSA